MTVKILGGSMYAQPHYPIITICSYVHAQTNSVTTSDRNSMK